MTEPARGCGNTKDIPIALADIPNGLISSSECLYSISASYSLSKSMNIFTET